MLACGWKGNEMKWFDLRTGEKMRRRESGGWGVISAVHSDICQQCFVKLASYHSGRLFSSSLQVLRVKPANLSLPE